jgi:hypothetical protein
MHKLVFFSWTAENYISAEIENSDPSDGIPEAKKYYDVILLYRTTYMLYIKLEPCIAS